MNLRTKFMLGAILAIFLYIGYFFLSHAYVFLKLTSVLSFMFVVMVLIVLLVLAFTRFGGRK